jgi:hypothetical protein
MSLVVRYTMCRSVSLKHPHLATTNRCSNGENCIVTFHNKRVRMSGYPRRSFDADVRSAS